VKKAKSSAPLRTRKRLQDERIAELLDVATEVFITEGFAAASTNEMARRARASKTTFYSRFPTKEELFLAVIARRMNRIFEQVTLLSPKPTLNDALRKFGMNLLTIALSPEQISLIRMVSMESGRYPELARQYYESGPKRAEEALAFYLDGQIRLGHVREGDTLMMARQFMNLITGSPVRWFVLGFESKPLSDDALQRHIDGVIGMFSRAYGCPPQAA